MTPAEVLAAARATGVTLWAEGDALRYRGPREARTAELLDQFKAHKAALMAELAAAADALLWRVAILEPDVRTVEVDTPSGWTLPDWQAYAQRYHGAGCAVRPIAGLPKARAPVNLDEALRTACEGAGITPEVLRSLLSPEDLQDVAAGDFHPRSLGAYARSFAEGMRSGRIGAPVHVRERAPSPIPPRAASPRPSSTPRARAARSE